MSEYEIGANPPSTGDGPVEQPRPNLWETCGGKLCICHSSICPDCGCVEAEAAHPATEGLDVERLTEAIKGVVPYPSTWPVESRDTWARHYAEGILARLPSPEGQEK